MVIDLRKKVMGTVKHICKGVMNVYQQLGRDKVCVYCILVLAVCIGFIIRLHGQPDFQFKSKDSVQRMDVMEYASHLFIVYINYAVNDELGF